MPEEHESTNKLLSAPKPTHGPVVGIIIVVFILLLGGIYFGIDRIRKEREARNQVPPVLNSTTTITIIVPSTSSPQ